MTRLMTFVAVALFSVGMVAGVCQAKEDRGPGRKGKKGDRMAKFTEGLELTDEQASQVATIMKAHRQAMVKQLKEVLNDEQMAKVTKRMKAMGRKHGPRGRKGDPLNGIEVTDEQRAKIKAIRDEMRSKMKAADTKEAKWKLMKQTREKVSEVLTDEQRAQMKKNLAKRWGKGPRGRNGGPLAGLKLTDEQKAKVKAIHEEMGPKLKAAETREARGKLMKQMHRKVSEVLTDDQKAQMKKNLAKRWGKGPHGRKGGPLGGLDLTDEQQAKIKAIHEEMGPKMRTAETREEKRKLRKQIREKIGDVLTDEQKEELKERRGKRRHGRGGKGGRDED